VTRHGDHARLSPGDIYQAAARLAGKITRTPVLSSPELDHALGAQVACKAENLQRTGAFKLRGALSHMLTLPGPALARGVIGASSGNHGHALAVAARMLGTRAVVVVPDDAPSVKVDAIAANGAQIHRYDRRSADRDAIVATIAESQRLCVVPSADSLQVMAGAGTVALEIMQELREPGVLLVPVGGGGLAAGCATIAKHIHPTVRLIGVEPASGDDTAQSLRAGRRVAIPPPTTIADGLTHTMPSPGPFAINQRLLDDVVTVDDDAIAEAMALCLRHLRVVVEPSGACGLAALIAGRLYGGCDKIAVVLSGGNVDWHTFRVLIDNSHARRLRELPGMPSHRGAVSSTRGA
jgi:threo-3-hydroxy-L-aspartate ammonia-lyase